MEHGVFGIAGVLHSVAVQKFDSFGRFMSFSFNFKAGGKLGGLSGGKFRLVVVRLVTLPWLFLNQRVLSLQAICDLAISGHLQAVIKSSNRIMATDINNTSNLYSETLGVVLGGPRHRHMHAVTGWEQRSQNLNHLTHF